MSQNKKYIIEVATNPASLKKLREDLEKATKLQEGVEIPELSRETKAQVKRDLATMFGVAEHQAEALQKMMQAAAEGFADGKSVDALKRQLEETLEFTNTIMQNMYKMDDATSWMDRGVTFVDDFIKMKDSIGVIESVEKSVGRLEKTFEKFKDALAETNADAFLQRFGTFTRNDAQEFALAQKTLQKLAKTRYKAVSEAIASGQSEEFDYTGYDTEELEAEYKDAIRIISESNRKIEQLSQKYKGKKSELYKDTDYLSTISDMSMALHQLDNMHGLGDGLGSELRASMQIATDSVREAGNEIQNLVKKLQGQGIELAITLPDAGSVKFASQINEFVKNASDEFKNHPIEMTLDITSPFKKDALTKDGELKKLSEKQLGLSQEIEKTFRENLQKEDMQIGEDDLKGLYSINTNVISRNIVDAFNKLYKSMTSGQALITSATKKWREKIEEDLTVKPTFATELAKKEVAQAIEDIEAEMEGGEYDLTLYPNTEQLVAEIQEALKADKFLIDVKVDNVDASGVVLNVDSAQINSGGYIPVGYAPMQFAPQGTPPTQPTPPTTQQTKEQPTLASSAQKTAQQSTTRALTQNSETVTEGTIAQRILTDAVNDLSQSLSTIDDRMQSVQDRISAVEKQRDKNAKEIENNQKSVDTHNKRREVAAANKQSSQEQLKQKKEDKVFEENQISNIQSELRNALKRGDIQGFNDRLKPILDKLPQIKTLIHNEIESIKSNEGMTEAAKETDITKLNSYIKTIEKLLNPDIDLTTAVNDQGTKIYFEAVRLAYRDSLAKLDEEISKLEEEVADRQRSYTNADAAVVNAREHARELSGEDTEENAEKQLEKFKSEKGALESRKKKIQKVLDNNEDPVTLVLDEVAEYWKTSDKKIADAEQYISKNEVKLKKLEKELESYEDKNSAEYKKKQKEYDEENARLHKDKKYVSSKNAIETWTERNAVMRAAGLDLKEMKSGNEIEEITRVLVENAVLADALSNNKSLKGLSNIQNMAYFIPKVQQTLGVDTRAYEDYMSEQELRSNFLEALKINEYIVAARNMLKTGDTDISPTDVQNFIDYFADIPEMADAVNIARQYLEEVSKLPEETWKKDIQETYFDQFKNTWESMDKDSRRAFADAYSDSQQAHGFRFTDFKNVDNDLFARILSAFNENESPLKGLQTDNKQIQQILGILQRSSLLTATKDISSQYGEHGILASLFGIQKSNLMGNKYAPKAPIYITTHDSKDREKIYELGAKGGRSQSSDGKFNFTPESFDRMIKKTNTADEMAELVSLIYDPLVLQNEKLEHKIRDIRSDLNTLKTLDFSDDESATDSKKKMRHMSYNALDGTDIEKDWHRLKNLQGEVVSIRSALKSGLDDVVLPDVLWKNIKGLRKQRGLEKEIRGLDHGEFSDEVKRQLKGLTDKEKEKKVKEIKSEKVTELDELKKQNIKDVTKFLLEKVKQYRNLEDQIIAQTDEVIASKEKELEAAETQHKKNAPIVAQRKREADELLQQMFESGKFKLSHGKGTVTPKWDQKYEYKDSKLAKFEEQKAINDRTIEILKQQNEDDRQLLDVLQSNKTNDKIDEMLNNLSDADKKKPKEAQLDLVKNKITTAISRRDAEIERLQNVEISLKDIIDSIITLEDDIERGKEKEKHESQLSSADRRRSKRVLNSNKRQFTAKRKAYESALYSEARQFNLNNQLKTSKTGSTQENQPEFSNLLSKIKLASDWEIFDTTKINGMVDEYLALIEKAKALSVSDTASDADIADIEKEIRAAQDKLIKEWFGTDSWYLVDLIEQRFSVIDGDLKREEQEIISEASSAKEADDATKTAIAEQKKKAKQSLEEYINQLKAQYIDKPKEEILLALNREVAGINTDAASVAAELEAVYGRADKALEEQRRALVQQYQNDPLYKQLLEQRSKVLNSEAYNLKDANSDEYKAAHKQVEDIGKSMAEIEHAYDQKFKELRDKWIAEEKERILKTSTKDSYSKNAYKLKEAYDKRDRDLATVHQRAQQDSGLISIKEQVAKELQKDEEYINLLQQYNKMSKTEQESESGKNIYSQIQSIKQKYEQKIVDAVNTWKNEEIKRINKTFDNTVSNIVNSILRNKRSGIRDNQLSTLEQQKEFVIDRLFIANSEFSDLVTNVIADLTKQLGNNPDAFQVSEELVKRGLPKDISFEDAFTLSTSKIETGEQYKVYFKRVQDSLLEQVGKMLQVMVDSANNPELVSEEQIKAQIEAKRAKAVKKKQEEVASIKGKTSRELLSDRYDDTSEEHAGKAAGIKRDREKLEADRKRIMRDYGKSHGLTPEMVAAARKGTLIVKLNAKKVETTTSQETPRKEQSTSKPQQTRQTAPTPQQQTTSQPMKPQGGSFVYGTYGYTPAIIDTSDLAKDGTLRGIYEVLNGGPPKGGWDDSISEGSKVHETPSPTPVDNESDEIAGSAQKFVSSLQSIISSAATRKTEMAALIGESGQLGARIQGTKNGVKAKDISAALAEQVKEQVLAVLHNHPSGSATLSSNDLQAAYNRAYSKGSYAGNKPVKISGAVANGKITAVDFSDIEESDAAKIVAEYQKQRDALVDATEEDIYNTLVSVFTQFGHANAVQQVDASKLEEWRNSIVSKAQQQVAEDVIETGAQTAVDVTKDIPQTDASTPTQTIEDVIGSDLPSDILSIYKAVFDKFDFKDALGNRINELIGKCRDYVEMQFEEGELTDEVIGDLFKVADNGELTIASEDLYKAKDIRNRIISILLDSIDDNFDINGFAKLYEDNKANIKQALESIIPDAYSSDSTSKKTPAKKEKASKKDKPVEQTSKPAEKAVKSAKEAENANRAITSEQEQQSTLSAEIAQNTEKAASAAKEQAKAQSEVVTSQKERVSSSATFDTGAQQQTTQPKSYEHNYKLGLAGLAQEYTLKSILGELSSGIKVTSDKKGGGGKQGGKKKSDDKSLNVTAKDAWATAQEYIKENYPDFTSLSALKPVSGGYSIDVFRPNNLEAYAAAQKKVNDLIAEGKQGTDEFNQAQAELNKLKFEQEKITLKIGNLNDEVQVTQEKSGFQNLALGIKAASKELQTVEGVLTQLHEVGALSIGADGAPTSSIASVDKYLGKLKALQDYQNKLSPEQLFDIDVQQDLSRLALDLQNARKEVMLLAKASAQLNIGEKIETDKLADGIEGLSDSGVKQVMKDIIADSTKLETSFKDLTPVTNEFGEVIGYKLAYTVRTSKHEVQEMTAVLNPLTNELRVQKGAVKDAATGWKVFFDGLKGKAASIMQYLISITSIHDMFRYVGQGVQYVREIDSALTELKKVTDETDASYAKFLQNMSKTGSVIGATVADLTTSAADWARLGYSMQQAGELAKNTSILMNVSEFEDVSKATDTLISALQAFKEEGQDVGTFSMEIIDKYNEVGNNYAISTSDLAESLTRSSAALVAANNSLEQSIAMTTAANTTIQDPESVGNALKTVSMRIRGVKTELEEAGEDTEGMVTNTAKLQEKIMALTNIDGSGGVDILTRSGDFKATYDILLEISKVWDKMGDVEQAALLEIVAGKTRGSVVAALFQNGDVLEKAYESALNASGSAMNELNNHLDSIQGRIDLFNNAVQTMWMNFINADAAKFIVNIGTDLINLVDKIGLLNVAVAGLFAGAKIKHELKKNDVDILGYIFDIAPEKIKNDPSIKNFIPTIKAAYSEILNGVAKDTMWDGGDRLSTIDILTNLTNFEDANAIMDQLSNAFNMEVVTKQQAKDILDSFDVLSETTKTAFLKTINEMNAMDLMAKLGNFDDTSGILNELVEAFGFEGDDLSSIFISTDKVKEVLDGFDEISDATKEAILDSASFAVAQTGAAAGTNMFTGALVKAKAAALAFGAGLKAFAIAHPIITGLTAAVIALGAAFLVYDAFTTSHDEYVEKLEEETEALQSVQSELQSVQSELETTKERMDELNAKGTLSFVEEEELNRLRQQTAELERQEKILLAQEQRARKKQINAALNAAKSDPNLRGQNTTTVPYAASQGQGTTSSTPYAAALQNANTPSLDDTGKNKYEINLQGLKEAREELAQYEEQLSNIDDAESAEYKNIEEKVESAKKRVEECNAAIDSMHESWQKEYGEVGYIENATEDYEKQWNEKYREHQNYLTQQAFINGDYDKADVLDQYFSNTGTDAAQQFKKEFEDAVKSGKDPTDVIEEMLSNTDYSSAFSGLKEQYGITMDHIGAYFTKVGEFKIDPEFSISKYSSDIKSHSAVISEFQDAIQSLGKGTFTMDDYLDLIERFPDLAKGVDISSNAFYGLSRNLNKAIKSRTKDFVRDLQDLRKSMIDAGKSTASIDQLIEAIENMPDDALDDTIERYSTLANEIDKARTAQDKLTASMEENPNQGYETRGEAMDYMKEAMKKGEIGSESNLWNVAKQYGFTYDSAKSINENADALAKFIAVREKWWKTADDGDDRTNDGYSYEGTENFIESVEKAVKESEEAGTRLSEILTWNYDETTGTFDFDFDNKDLPEIISLLGETEELIGLTTEEWMDLMVQVGQFFNIKWAKADDVIDYITKVSEGSEEASTKVDLMTDSVEAYVEKALGKDIDFSSLTEAGIEALTTDEKIRELLRTYLSLKQSIEDPLGLNIDGASLTTVMSSLDKLGIQYGVVRDELGQQIGIDITASDLITTLQEKGWTKEQISSYLQTLTSTENGLGITVNGKANMDKTEVDALLTTVGQIPETETITADIAGTAVGAVAGLKTDLATLTSETHVIDVDVRQTGSLPSIPSNIPSYAAAAGANGTAHVQGTAFNTGSWGAPESETALVGELGPELLVRNGRWTTVGDNGAEFTQVKRGDIIFNHKQTESLLKNGYVTGRGKAYASGNAFASGSGIFSRYEFSGDGGYVKYDVNDKAVDKFGDAASGLSNAADDLSDSTDEFKEVFDWIEVRLEELDETLSLLEAKLENVVYYNEKNNIIDDIIAVNKTKLENLNAGYAEYTDYAAELLTKIPAKYRDAAQNGAIAIEKFVGEADETTLEAINNYREWIQKAADLKQQAEEITTTIRDLAIQKFDNAYEYGSVRATVEDSQTEKLQNQVDLLEEMGEIASSVYYGTNGGDAANSTGMFENSYKKIEYLTEARKAMQAELNAAVEAGQIKEGSNEWYDLIDQMYQIDSEIHEATAEIEEFQNAINDIYWENFDQLISRIDYLKDETQNLIDLMDSEDMVVDPVKRKYENGTVEYWTADDVQWSKEGLASLGLYAQQMEIAEYKAKQYAGAIDDLTKEYNAGHYSENEYYEKLNELKDAQYESIEAYYDAQDAIKDLNQTRIDSIKKGIEKEIEAYEELIEKKKEALDADKDMHDFQKSIMEQQKNISDIERKLAALSSDNSLSAAAKRKQLEAELAEARAELEEQYYDRSIEDQQNALDKELENFQKEKDEEVTKMEEYLEDIKQVVADSLNTVQANASGIYDTLIEKATEYDLTLSDSILTPWQDGALAVSDYQETFDTAMSSTMDQLEALKNKWQEVIDKMAEAGNTNVAKINQENTNYTAATYTEPTKTTTTSSTTSKQQDVKVGDLIDAGNAKICTDSNGSNPSTQYYSTDPVYAVVDEKNGYVAVRHRSRSDGVSGWFKSSQIRKYAKGTTSVNKDGLALIDELGEELELIPDGNGRLAYMKKGTGVVPADLTENLMGWGKLDPTNMLEQNKPQIGISPSVVNNTTEIHIDASVGELLHVEHLEGNNPSEITKIVDKAWDKHMKELNAHVRRYTNR